MPLSPDRYLDSLRGDAQRFIAAASAVALDAPVPTCPDWDVRALVEHLGVVYLHKVSCMRLQRQPEEGGDWRRTPGPGEDDIAWFRGAFDELVDELVSRGPGAPSYTWHPADQTVAFWYRRMAQETLVHRVDAELAAGHVSDVPEDMAVDGIDEVLDVFLTGPWWESEPVGAATGRTVAVRSGGAGWWLTPEPTRVVTSRAPQPSTAEVEGAPYDVLMWVWGREPKEPVKQTGDESALAELRARIDYCID